MRFGKDDAYHAEVGRSNDVEDDVDSLGVNQTFSNATTRSTLVRKQL